jgi:hypothetical protein
MFRICSEFSVMFSLFRICSEFSVMFRICSEFSVMFRLCSEYLALKLVCSESLDFVVFRLVLVFYPEPAAFNDPVIVLSI